MMPAEQNTHSVKQSHMVAASIEGVLDVIGPGEMISYAALLACMKEVGHGTGGVGNIIEQYRFRRGGDGELVTWREPYWDEEHEGGWAEGTLWIKRRESA